MILVVGASGLLGGMITRQLLERGETVRILQRQNPAYERLIEQGAQAVRGDLKDRASLDAACQAVDVVITTANAALRGGEDTFETVDRQGTKNLIEAAEAAGVRQFIYMSAYASDLSSPVPLVRYKVECEQRLREGRLAYTILQPHIFIEVWAGAVIGIPLRAGQPVTLVGRGDKRHSFVSVSDVAAVTVATVRNPAAYHQEIPVGGPGPVSWTEMVQLAGNVIGRSVDVRYVEIGQPVPLLPEAMLPLLYSTETYETNIDMSVVSHTYGVAPTPIQDTLRHMFAGVTSSAGS